MSFTAAARTGRAEPALRKQAGRPLEKLNRLLRRRGVVVPAVSPASSLGGVLCSPPDLVLASLKRVAGLSEEEGAKVKVHLAVTRLNRQRNSLRFDLTPAGRIAVQAELALSSDASLTAFLGEERFKKYEAWRKSKQRADAEFAARQGLSRISRAVPLRPEQKDALYSGFVTAALDPAAQSLDPLTQFRITSSISEEPGGPHILDEAQTILSPEQWAQYHEQATLASQGQNMMTQHLMGMMPVLLSSLQEMIEESAAAEKAK